MLSPRECWEAVGRSVGPAMTAALVEQFAGGLSPADLVAGLKLTRPGIENFPWWPHLLSGLEYAKSQLDGSNN